jgi:hypothetical protein
MTDHNYREISAQKSVSSAGGSNDDNFVRGVIDFNFSANGSTNVWIPRKSYLKITLEIRGKLNTILRTSDCTALADDVCGGLFNNCSLKAGGQDVSAINNYVAQASILKNRYGRTDAWLKSVGRSGSFVEADLTQRIGMLACDTPSDVTPRPIVLPLVNVCDIKVEPTVTINAANGVVTGNNTTQFKDVLESIYGVGNLNAFNLSNVKLHLASYALTVLSVTDNDTLGVEISAPENIGPATGAYFVVQKPNDADSKNKRQFIYQPPLGIFDLQSNDPQLEVLGAADFRLSLNPNSNYKFACIETLRKGAAQGGPDDLRPNAPLRPGQDGYFDIVVHDIKFMMAFCSMKIESPERNLTLSELMILSKPLSGASNTYEFSVPSSTQMVAVWVQSSAQGTNCNFPPSKFKTVGNTQNLLSGFQLTYANTTKPSTKWQSAFTVSPSSSTAAAAAGNTNELIQRYHDNLAEVGLYNQTGGAETVVDFLERGLYVIYSFIRDQTDKSTQLQVSLDFSGAVEPNASVYVGAIYNRMTEIKTADGMVTSVRSLN